MKLLPALVGGSRVKTLKISQGRKTHLQFLHGLAPQKDARRPSFLLRTKTGADTSSRRPPPYSLPLLALAQQCSRGTQSCLPHFSQLHLDLLAGPFDPLCTHFSARTSQFSGYSSGRLSLSDNSPRSHQAFRRLQSIRTKDLFLINYNLRDQEKYFRG